MNPYAKPEEKPKEQIEMEKAYNELERQIVRFTNIDKESFTHSFKGISTTVASGASQPMTLPEADHLATHLARKILSRTKKSSPESKEKGVVLWTEKEVAELKAKILTPLATENAPVNISAEEAHKQELKDLAEKYKEPAKPITKKDIIAEIKRRTKKEPDVNKSKDELLQELMGLEEQGIV